MKDILLALLCITVATLVSPAEQKRDLDQENDSLHLQRVNQYNAHKGPVTTVHWHPTHPLLASGSESAQNPRPPQYISLCLRNTAENEQTNFSLSRGIAHLQLLSTEGIVVGQSTAGSPSVEVLHNDGNRHRKINNKHCKTVCSMSAHPFEQKAALAGTSYRPIVIWDIEDDTYSLLPYTANDDPQCVAYAPEGNSLAAGNKNGVVKIFDLTSDTLIISFEPTTTPINAVSWNPHQPLLAVGFNDTTYIYDTRNHQCLQQFALTAGVLKGLTWYSENSLVSGSSDGVVRLWNSNTGKCTTASLLLNNGSINALDYSRITEELAVGDDEGKISIFKILHNVGNDQAEEQQ